MRGDLSVLSSFFSPIIGGKTQSLALKRSSQTNAMARPWGKEDTNIQTVTDTDTGTDTDTDAL